jgi:hypothetical protein
MISTKDMRNISKLHEIAKEFQKAQTEKLIISDRYIPKKDTEKFGVYGIRINGITCLLSQNDLIMLNKIAKIASYGIHPTNDKKLSINILLSIEEVQ